MNYVTGNTISFAKGRVRERRALEHGDHRISAAGLLQASLSAADVTIEDADALPERIEADPRGVPGVPILHRPCAPRDRGRSHQRAAAAEPASVPGLEAAKIELPADASPRLPWCAAVRAVTLRTPELFGPVDDMPGHMARCAELRARLDELFGTLEGAWSAADVELHAVTSGERDRGRCRLIIRGTSVPIGDRLGERLVNTLLAREHAAEAA